MQTCDEWRNRRHAFSTNFERMFLYETGGICLFEANRPFGANVALTYGYVNLIPSIFPKLLIRLKWHDLYYAQ